jgi:hypothetical protein
LADAPVVEAASAGRDRTSHVGGVVFPTMAASSRWLPLLPGFASPLDLA